LKVKNDSLKMAFIVMNGRRVLGMVFVFWVMDDEIFQSLFP
jgi:hypothetical protein